jgi:NitT/TauT family transport system substrate-binding protein
MRWPGSFVGVAVAAMLSALQPAQAQDRLKIAQGGRGVGEAFVPELGQNAGIFKKHGIELEIFYTQGGGETIQIVISGAAHIGGQIGFLGTIGAFAKGAPIRIIGSNFTGGKQLFWYVRAESPIKSLKDAAGKTVSYSTNGSSTHTSVLALKKFTGVDFVPTQVGSAQASYTQVMSGQVDVGWAGAPFGVDAVEQGRIRVIAKASDDPVLDRQTIRLMVANSNEMAKRPDVFVRFMRAYREALAWVYSTPEGLSAYAKWASISEPTAKRALQEFLPRDAVDPDRISGIDDVMADAVTHKYMSAPLSKQQIDELIQIPERKQ